MEQEHKSMERIQRIRDYVNHYIDALPFEEERRSATIHTYGVAQLCTMIALKRGLDPELAHISGLLHDVYTYFAGSSLYHAINGAEMVRPAIRDMNIFTQEEKEIILSSIFYHSDKTRIHDKYNEVLKDADVLQHYWNDACFRIDKSMSPRLTKVLGELGMDASCPATILYEQDADNAKGIFQKAVFADIAEGCIC
jgi:hypothetical protein